MKRHQALTPLSREHHEGLILAKLLQKNAPAYKGLPLDADEKVVYALKLYHNSLQEHFRKEEEILATIKNTNSLIDEIAAEIIAEHRVLASGFMSLRDNSNLVEALDAVGQTLESHIRKEERVLFPLIEKYCSEEVLNAFDL